MMNAIESATRRIFDNRTLAVLVAIFWFEMVLLVGYVLYAPVRITDPQILVYPLVWINVSLFALWQTDSPTSSTRIRYFAGLLGLGYFILLVYLGGLISPGSVFGGHAHTRGLRIAWPLPPGWGPAIRFSGSLVGLSIIPYKVLGYATLAYLVFVTILDTARGAWAGVLGVFSCVSCTWPLLGTILAGTLGSSSAAVVFATEQPFWASTLVFISAIGLLLWRPFTG